MTTAGVRSLRTPVRRPWSVRRTTTIDMTWPDGPTGSLVQVGRGRDLRTGAEPDDTAVLGECELRTVVSPDRVLTAVDPGPRALVGSPAIVGLRRRLATVPDPAFAPGGLAFQLLDDIPGATIVSEFAERQWGVHDPSRARDRRVVGVCTGFTPGSSALNLDGTSKGNHRTAQVAPLPRPDDRASWHAFPEPTVMAMRRARLLDVRVVGGDVRVDALFEDSSTAPGGGRVAVHQYVLQVRAQTDDLRITSVAAHPGNLPYAECPFATANVGSLLGVELGDLRHEVARTLRGTAGCTHLNDALRALSDVPHLVRALVDPPGAQPCPGTTGSPAGSSTDS